MHTRDFLLGAALLSLAACSGGAASAPAAPSATATPTASPAPGSTASSLAAQSSSESAVSATNSVGTPIAEAEEYDKTISPLSNRRVVKSLEYGSCSNQSEFFAPDKNNDANSTELQLFYDSACTELARDTVRIVESSTTSSETVSTTVQLYALGNSSPIAVRTESIALTNATFDTNGYPIPATGFDRTQTGQLNITGTKTISDSNEIVMLPSSGSTNSYCSDGASFNATGFASLNETFGVQNEAQSATRTVNGDGSVTYAFTSLGSLSKGSIGSLSIGAGTQNTACPITTPMFTLAGGSQLGSYSFPISATYANHVLTNLTITNGTLPNGNTLNVTTSAGAAPSSSTFITGVVTNGATQVATFNVDAFGDGTVTATLTGKQYGVTDWNVTSASTQSIPVWARP